AKAALEACAAAALCAGGEAGTASAPGRCAAPCGVWLPGGYPSRAGPPGWADQYRLCGADHPHPPPTCGRGGTTGQHAVHTLSRLAPAAGVVSCLSQLLSAPCQPPSASVTAPAHPWPWRGPNVATADTGHGRGADRSRLDAARGAPASRAALAPASGGMSKPRWWAAAREGGLSRRR